MTFNPFTLQDSVILLIVILLLGVSASVSASETAFFSLSPRDVVRLKNSPDRRSNAILRLLSADEYLLATILVVNNLVNICIVILSNGLIDSLTDFGGAAGLEFVVKTVVVTFLLLLFGEILPKVLAQTIPLRFASMVARPLLVLRWC